MSRYIDDFAPSPEAAAAAEAAYEADRARIDPTRVARFEAELDAGGGHAGARLAAEDVEALARAGVSPAVVGRVLKAGRDAPPEAREAIMGHVGKRLAKPAAAAGEEPVPARWPLPDLDTDRLLARCSAARDHAKATARLALSSDELPVLVWIAAVSCALAAKVVGLTHNNDGSDYPVWPHVYLCAEAASTANKSLILNRMLRNHLSKPGGVWDKIRGEQREAADRDADERASATVERDALRRKTGDAVTPDVVARLRELNERLAQPPLVAPAVCETGAPTPEVHVILSHASGFRAFVPDEGAGLLNRFLGTKPTEAKVEPLIAGFDGDPWSYPSIAGRQREEANPRFPLHHLVMVLLVQPGVLSPKAEEEARRLQSAADRGVFPRMLCARTRPLDSAAIDALEARAAALAEESAGCAKRYERILRAIADLRVGDHPLQPREPIVLAWAPEATKTRRAYQVRLKKDVALDGPDAGKPGERSIARLADHAARLAEVLAVWRLAETADDEGRALSVDDIRQGCVELDDVERAIEVCQSYFRPHALAVAGRAILDPVGADADTVLQVLRGCPELISGVSLSRREVSRRYFRQGWGRTAGGRHRLNEALEELERRGDVELDGTGRKSILVRLVTRA